MNKNNPFNFVGTTIPVQEGSISSIIRWVYEDYFNREFETRQELYDFIGAVPDLETLIIGIKNGVLAENKRVQELRFLCSTPLPPIQEIVDMILVKGSEKDYKAVVTFTTFCFVQNNTILKDLNICGGAPLIKLLGKDAHLQFREMTEFNHRQK